MIFEFVVPIDILEQDFVNVHTLIMSPVHVLVLLPVYIVAERLSSLGGAFDGTSSQFSKSYTSCPMHD